MRTGMSAQKSAESAITSIRKKYPYFKGAVVAADVHGNIGECLNKTRDIKFGLKGFL